MQLIVGLGNPERRFHHSRHNVGFWCLEHMARQWSIPLSERRAKAVLGQGRVDDRLLVLAKPRTFVNHSGEAVRYLLDRFHASPQELLVVYDDMDLPIGKLRLRPDGGAGGHNGLKSIIATIATQQFPRMRIGIGRPSGSQNEIDFVLGPFNSVEKEMVEEVVELGAQASLCVIRDGLQQAMNRFNGPEDPAASEGGRLQARRGAAP